MDPTLKERKKVEEYLADHALELHLNDVVNGVVRDLPLDPYLEISNQIEKVRDSPYLDPHLTIL